MSEAKQLELDYNLFSCLYKYKQTKKKNNLENFTTEGFAYLLKYLINKNPKMAHEILGLFGIKNDDKIESINTQFTTEVCGNTIRPDIYIETQCANVFIEVKIDAYQRLGSTIKKSKDQLGDYLQIKLQNKKKTQVFSLSKNYINTESEINGKIRWHEISAILKKYENKDILVDNFINFLEENYMGEQKPLTAGIEKIINLYQSYKNLLSTAYENSKFNSDKKYKLNGNVYNEDNGIGYFVKRNGEDCIWFGILPEKPKKIILEICSPSENVPQNDKDNSGNPIIAEKEIKDITIRKSFKEQEEILRIWLDGEYKTITEEKYIK